MIKKGNVDNINEEGLGKECDSFVVIVSVWEEVRAARQGIGTYKEFSWDMDHFESKVCKVNEPSGLLTVESLRDMEVCEIFVIGEDLDGKW